jgi:hypothetical protein
MKVFNGKKAAEDYMSTHTLTFSTPDLTLKRFAFWLGDMVPDPEGKEEPVPRIMTLVEEQDFAPVLIVDDDKYVPTGAVRDSGVYGNPNQESSSDTKFCPECGAKNSSNARFCTECGANQD